MVTLLFLWALYFGAAVAEQEGYHRMNQSPMFHRAMLEGAKFVDALSMNHIYLDGVMLDARPNGEVDVVVVPFGSCDGCEGWTLRTFSDVWALVLHWKDTHETFSMRTGDEYTVNETCGRDAAWLRNHDEYAAKIGGARMLGLPVGAQRARYLAEHGHGGVGCYADVQSAISAAHSAASGRHEPCKAPTKKWGSATVKFCTYQCANCGACCTNQYEHAAHAHPSGGACGARNAWHDTEVPF